jgi:hypothetical protein
LIITFDAGTATQMIYSASSFAEKKVGTATQVIYSASSVAEKKSRALAGPIKDLQCGP